MIEDGKVTCTHDVHITTHNIWKILLLHYKNTKGGAYEWKGKWKKCIASKNMEAYSLLFLQLQVDNHYQPFNARILVFGFISAESAVMGLLKGWFGILISIITILFCGAVSRTQIYLSDSMVTCVKVINCGLIPTVGSCNHQITQKPITQHLIMALTIRNSTKFQHR